MRQVTLRQLSLRILMLVTLAVVTVGASGCASIATGDKGELPLADSSSASETFTVEVVSPYSKGSVKRGVVSSGLTVQSALKNTGILNMYRNPQVTIYRRIPDRGEVLKLACEFQPNKRKIKYEQDYAVLAGDRLIVEPRSNPLERLFNGN